MKMIFGVKKKQVMNKNNKKKYYNKNNKNKNKNKNINNKYKKKIQKYHVFKNKILNNSSKTYLILILQIRTNF